MAFLSIADMPASAPNHPTPAIAGTRWDDFGGTLEAVVCGSAGVPGETRLQLQSVIKDAAENELPRHPWVERGRTMARACAAFTFARARLASYLAFLACSLNSIFTCAACSSTAAPPRAKPFRSEAWGNSEEKSCLLYTSPSPRDVEESRMPSSA